MLYRAALGYAIRTERMKQGRTTRDVAGQAFLAHSYLSDIERGQKDPSSEFIVTIANALDIPTSKLIRETSNVLADWEAQVKEEAWV